MKVTLVMAMTLDGKIGKSADHFPDWTGKEDKKLFVEITRRAGVVIMGSRTFLTIGKPLPGRKNIILTRNPRRTSDDPNLVFSGRPPKEILAELEKEGYQEAILAGGALINSLFAKEQLIDEMVVTLSPMIFGQGLSLFTEDISMDLELLDVSPLGRNRVCLRYRVCR